MCWEVSTSKCQLFLEKPDKSSHSRKSPLTGEDDIAVAFDFPRSGGEQELFNTRS